MKAHLQDDAERVALARNLKRLHAKPKTVKYAQALAMIAPLLAAMASTVFNKSFVFPTAAALALLSIYGLRLFYWFIKEMSQQDIEKLSQHGKLSKEESDKLRSDVKMLAARG
jgi:hypothetical protein